MFLTRFRDREGDKIIDKLNTILSNETLTFPLSRSAIVGDTERLALNTTQVYAQDSRSSRC